MNTIPKTAWESVADKVALQLNPTEKSKVTHLNTGPRVEAVLSTFKTTAQTPELKNVCARLDTIFRLSTLLSDAAYELSQKLEDVCKLIWGLLGLAVESSARDTEFLDLVVRMYEDILNCIPRLRSFTAKFESSPNLTLAIFDIYKENIDLGLRAVQAFGRGSISIVTKLKWKREQKAFRITVRRLKRLKDIAIQEAGAANIDGEQVWRDTVLAAVTGGDTASLRTVGNVGNADLASLSLTEPRFPQFLVPPRNTKFVGREDEISLLEGILDPQNSATAQKFSCVALHGLGGVGKSQIASEFAHRHRAHYDACYWISADTPVKIAQSFGAIARKLLIEEVDQPQLRARVMQWFCETDKSWLLIFDNAEEPLELQEYFPSAPSGAILLTSQYRDWVNEEIVDRGIHVKSMSPEQGIQMLQSIMQRYNQNVADETASDIVKDVGGLPLAIRQIGSYIATTHENPRKFLSRYQDSVEGQKVDSWTVSGSQSTSHSLATVWRFALAKLSPPSIYLLNIMVLLDPDSIPLDFFPTELQSGTLSPHLNSLAEYHEAFSKLQSYSLVFLSSTEDRDTVITIHRQVRRNVVNMLGPNELRQAFEWTLKKLRKEFPHQSPFAEPLSRSWPQCEAWISHLVSVNSNAHAVKTKFTVPAMLAEILVDGSIYLWERGLLEQGRQLILSAKALCQDNEGEKLLLASIFSFYGCILSDSGKLDEALVYFEQEVNSRKQHLIDLSRSRGKPTMYDEIQLANAYNNLAGILCAHGRFKDAELNNKLSLALKERWKDRADVEYLLSLSYSNLANVYGQQQIWDPAAEWYQKALSIKEEKRYAPPRALIYHNFGAMRLMQGLVQSAIALLTEAVQIRIEHLGDHYDTANTSHLLACCYHKLGDLINARDLLVEALRILDRPHLRDLARIARTKFRLSLVLAELNDANADRTRLEAIEAKNEILRGGLTDNDGEEDFDALVPYI